MRPFLNGRTPKAWILTLALALALWGGARLLAEPMRERLETTNKQLVAEQGRLARQLSQWKDDAATAQRLAETMKGDDLETYLAPASRAFVAAKLEPLAKREHIAHLIYALSPAAPWTGDASFPNMQGIVKSQLSLEGDAPHDAAVALYLRSLAALPGRMDIEKLTITRLTGTQGGAPGALNVHFKADLVWLASGDAS